MSIEKRDLYFLFWGGICGIGVTMIGDAISGVAPIMDAIVVGSGCVGLYIGFAFYHEYFILLFEKRKKGVKV